MKYFSNNLIRETKISIERFFSTFCLTVLLFLVSGYMVIFDLSRDISKIMFQIILTVSFSILFCTLGKILFEKYGERLKNKKLLVEVGLVLLSALAYPALKGYQDSNYVLMGYFGVMLALFVGIIYIANTGNISKTFSYILKSTVFNWLICCIVTVGTSLSILAFYLLIFNFENVYKIYSVNTLFIWIVLFLNLSLSAIPRKDVELKIPNIFKVIIAYVALPVYLLLIAILYVYLGKILITLSFPSGQINWFASFVSLLFVFFVFALEQYKEESGPARVFVKFGGYIVLPIIAVQFMAMYIRLSNYGLTTSRYASLALNIIALIFALVSLIKNGKHIKKMLIVAAGVSLLLTVTPLNLYDIPIWEQTVRLTHILSRNDMIENGKIVANENISKEDKIRITSAYDYLDPYHNKDKQELPDIIKNTDREGFEALFGFSREYEENYRHHSNSDYLAYHYRYDVVDIENYSKLYYVSSYISHNTDSNTFNLSSVGRTIDYDITQDIKALYADYGKTADSIKMEFQIGDDKLILTYVDFTVDKSNQLTITSFEGYYLEM